jgi:carbamoyl-phosphate synthase small subunit
MRHRRQPVFSVQCHPEASAGPRDSGYLFEEFRRLMG